MRTISSRSYIHAGCADSLIPAMPNTRHKGIGTRTKNTRNTTQRRDSSDRQDGWTCAVPHQIHVLYVGRRRQAPTTLARTESSSTKKGKQKKQEPHSNCAMPFFSDAILSKVRLKFWFRITGFTLNLLTRVVNDYMTSHDAT